MTISRLFPAIVFLLLGSNILTAQEARTVTSAERSDPATHPGGLTLVLQPRMRFNNFLGQVPPTFVREQRIAEDVMAQLRKLSKDRYLKQVDKLAELKPEWSDANVDTRRKLVEALGEYDDSLLEEQLDALRELLAPRQQLLLFREYMRSGSTRLLLDPSVARWIGLTDQELASMRARHEAANAILREGRSFVRDRYKPIPRDLDAEYRKLRERVWMDLSEEKIVKCLRALGLVGEEEGLEEYLKYFPDRAQMLVEEVPAFSVAKLRMDSKAR